MSNLLKILENPPFSQWYKWVDVDIYGVPKDSLSSALKQPNTIQIRLKIPGNGRDAQTKERCDDVIPDKVMLGAEYAIVHVLLDF